jgi:hypothetical protein
VALGLIELEFRVLIFTEGGKPENQAGEKPSWQGREPTNNSTHMKYPSQNWTRAGYKALKAI